MELYYWLTMIAIVTEIIPCIYYSDITDAIYAGIVAVFVLLQLKMHAFSWGDAKLFFLSLEMLLIQRKGMDILIDFLLLELTSVTIFLFYVFLLKRYNNEKKTKYPYAPAIFAGTLCCLIWL